MRLHHSRVAIAIDNESRQIVALTMHPTIGSALRIVQQSYRLPHVQSRTQMRLPKSTVDGDVVERQHTHGYRTYLVHTNSYEFVIACEHTHEVAFCYIFIHLCNSSGKNPWMKTLKTVFLTFF